MPPNRTNQPNQLKHKAINPQKALPYIIHFVLCPVICFIIGLYGLNAWGVMYLLTLPCCGFGTMATGIILKEKSLLIGGLFSMIVGGLFMICYICQINILGYDIFIFALCFALMMVVPGHVLNSKAKTRC